MHIDHEEEAKKNVGNVWNKDSQMTFFGVMVEPVEIWMTLNDVGFAVRGVLTVIQAKYFCCS